MREVGVDIALPAGWSRSPAPGFQLQTVDMHSCIREVGQPTGMVTIQVRHDDVGHVKASCHIAILLQADNLL